MVENKSRMASRSPGGRYYHPPPRPQNKIEWEASLRGGEKKKLTFDLVSFRCQSEIQKKSPCRVEIDNYCAINRLQDCWESDTLKISRESVRVKLVSFFPTMGILSVHPSAPYNIVPLTVNHDVKRLGITPNREGQKNSNSKCGVMEAKGWEYYKEGGIVSYNPRRPIKMRLLRLSPSITLVPFITPIFVESWRKSQSFELWIGHSGPNR